ncbi:rcc01693 family protein [Albidovulum sp.]
MSGLDWPGLMRAGLGRLRLSPEVFWGLTPAELALMLGDPASPRPLDRARLAELARAWPDAPMQGRDERDAGDGRTGRIRGAGRPGGGAGDEPGRGPGDDGGL